jgi:lysozyme family protein
MRLTKAMAEEYRSLWNTTKITRLKSSLNTLLDRINSNKARYERVAAETNVPWQVIAAIHAMESSCRFDRHLHNGDPLSARTVNVPKGRPKSHNGPFTWEESAIDALRYQAMDKNKYLTIEEVLYILEKYNGWGYRNRGIHTPYLWSGTNHYTSGKYVMDGKYDPSAVSKQIGVVPLLKGLGF